MNQQKNGLKEIHGDRTWKQIGHVIFLEYRQDEQVTKEWLVGQVSKVTGSLAVGNPLILPDLILKQIEASILRAVLSVSTGDFEKVQQSPAYWVVQVRTFVMDLAVQSHETGLFDDRWGFFVVQKQGDQKDTSELFLDLYLYQE